LTKKVAVILARGGSKRIPDKNLKLVGGVTLLERAIRAATENNLITVVSSDSSEVLNLAESVGVYTHHRSSENSGDESSSEDAILEVLLQFNHLKDFAEVVLIPTTSPFRNSKVLRDFLAEWESRTSQISKQAISVHRENIDIWVYRDLTPSRLRTELGIDFASRRSQDRKPFFVENSAIYISNIKTLEEKRTLVSENVSLIEIPKIAGFDINEPYDLVLANQIWEISQSFYGEGKC
jgi:CMP-N-acetylneuraminic acid synthetase